MPTLTAELQNKKIKSLFSKKLLAVLCLLIPWSLGSARVSSDNLSGKLQKDAPQDLDQLDTKYLLAQEMMWLHYIGQHLLSRLKLNLGDLSNE